MIIADTPLRPFVQTWTLCSHHLGNPTNLTPGWWCKFSPFLNFFFICVHLEIKCKCLHWVVLEIKRNCKSCTNFCIMIYIFALWCTNFGIMIYAMNIIKTCYSFSLYDYNSAFKVRKILNCVWAPQLYSTRKFFLANMYSFTSASE